MSTEAQEAGKIEVEELHECIVCAGAKFAQVVQQGIFNVVKCKYCGFVFVKNRPSLSYLQQYYNAMGSMQSMDGNYTPKRAKNIGRILKYRLFKAWIQRRFKENIYLLELGCSDGDLLAVVQGDKRWKAVGLDYAQRTVDFARSEGLDARLGDIQTMDFKRSEFNLVVGLHVIEHIHDPLTTIERIRFLLQDGGYVFFVVPCISHIKARLAGNNWKYFDAPGHLWYFNPKTMKLFLEKNGFEVLVSNCLYHRAHLRVLARKK